MEAKSICISGILIHEDSSVTLRRGADEWPLLVLNGNPENPNAITLWGVCRLSVSLQRATITSEYAYLDFNQPYPYVPEKLKLGRRDRTCFVLELLRPQ